MCEQKRHFCLQTRYCDTLGVELHTRYIKEKKVIAANVHTQLSEIKLAYKSIMASISVRKDEAINPTSKPYIDMTIDSMKMFGVEAENNNYKQLKVKAGQAYEPCEYVVEGDFSGASYLLLLTRGEYVNQTSKKDRSV